MSADITCVFPSLSHKGAIYISNFNTALNLPLLQRPSHFYSDLSIHAILTLTNTNIHYDPQIFHHLSIKVEDCETETIKEHFETTYDFIDCHRKDSNVLVHCKAGISRSPTVVIAYLMKKYEYSLSETTLLIKRKRNKVPIFMIIRFALIKLFSNNFNHTLFL